MAGDRNELTSYRIVKPYQQGQLGNLCGIYAAINAARLLSPEAAGDHAIWADAFSAAVHHLHTHRRLRHGLVEGITYESWKILQLAVYDGLSDRLSTSFRMRPLMRRSVETPDMRTLVRGAIDNEQAVLCALCGPFNHYTVIAGYTAKRWLLHDSHALRWLETTSTAIGGKPNRRNWLPSNVLFVLGRVGSR